ncbi:MAG: hypothetical protein SF029_22465, partial [bacterium]|nr:hypothetical protein [bacterium]
MADARSSDSTARTRVHRPARWRLALAWLRKRLEPLVRPLIRRVWSLHSPAVLMIRAQPNIIVRTLATATKPSTQRLQHRNLFAGGRRYFVYARRGGGFRMTTTARVIWRYRQRTNSSAILTGSFSAFGEDATRVQLDSRISLTYVLTGLIVPTFVASIIYFVPWHPAIVVGLIVILYTLSLMGHRYHAALEANEMVWFVQKVLDDL